MRRNVGLSSLGRHSLSIDAYSSLSSSLQDDHIESLRSQLATFQHALQTFASRHHRRILADPEFRKRFSDMCAHVGVDPLGGHAAQPGGIGNNSVTRLFVDPVGLADWTHALAVQILDVCLATQDRNGGLLDLDQLVRHLSRLRPGTNESLISADDVQRALDALAPLGPGYSLVRLADRVLVRSQPSALPSDVLILLDVATPNGYVDANTLCTSNKGINTRSRAEDCLHSALLVHGLVWIDEQNDNDEQEPLFWVPSLWTFKDDSTVST